MQVDRNSASHSASVGILNTALAGIDCTSGGLVQGSSVVGVSPLGEGDRDRECEAAVKSRPHRPGVDSTGATLRGADALSALESESTKTSSPFESESWKTMMLLMVGQKKDFWVVSIKKIKKKPLP
jgi:hypothetical protein